MPTSHSGEMSPAAGPPMSAIGTAAKVSPPTAVPQPILVAAWGSRAPSRSHNHANTGARAMMATELMDKNQDDGNEKPSIDVRVLSCANSDSTVEPCSNIIQNATEAMNSGM